MRLDALFPYRLARIASVVGEAMAAVHASRFGLTRDEWRVLAAAGEAEATPTRAVAEATGLDKVAISRAASKLEEAGLIWRTEARDDRRIKILHVSEQGARVLSEVDRIVREREAFLLEGLDPDDRSRIDEMLDRLEDRAEALVSPENAARCRPDCSGACTAGDAMMQKLTLAMAS